MSGNNLNWKNVKYWMDTYNPYNPNNKDGDSETYSLLWNTVRNLARLNFTAGNDIFPKMVKYDGELYKKEY